MWLSISKRRSHYRRHPLSALTVPLFAVCGVTCFLYGVFLTIDYNSADVQTGSNNTWTGKRQALLSSRGVRKLLLVCYMRGGSSLVGEVFNQDPRVALWYEPLASFFSHYYGVVYGGKSHHLVYNRDGTPIELEADAQTALTTFVSSLMECDVGALPPHTWLHRYLSQSSTFMSVYKCVGRHIGKGHLVVCQPTTFVCGQLDTSSERHCPRILREGRRFLQSTTSKHQLIKKLNKLIESSPEIPRNMLAKLDILADHLTCIEQSQRRSGRCGHLAQTLCEKSEIRVAEVHRLKMSDLEGILADQPDLHVIHYVRDPRGIALSRIKTLRMMLDPDRRDVTQEAQFVCKRMREDLRNRRLLEAKYPGAIHQVKYEDLVLDPGETVKHMYDIIGRDSHNNWQSVFECNGCTESIYKTQRQNGSESVLRWRDGISKTNLSHIKADCADVLSLLDYPLL